MKPDSAAEWIATAVVLVVVVSAFAVDRLWGWRALGLAEAAWGVWMMVTRRIPYGIEGRPPVGHITGGFAVAIGLAAVALGALFILAPAAVDAFLGGTDRHGN